MRFSKTYLTTLFFCMLSSGMSAKMRCLPIYAFGVSASFNDSLVYITDIQIIDSAWIDDKTNFLIKRNDYSSQLRSYMVSRGEPNRTCIFAYATTEKEIQKKYDRIRKKFAYVKKRRKSGYDIRDLHKSDFSFERVEPDVIDDNAVIDNKAVRKAEKARGKQAVRDEKRRKDDERREADSEKDRPSLPPRRI